MARWTIVFCVAIVFFYVAKGYGAIRTCLHVEGPNTKTLPQLERLVHSEVDKYPSHTLVTDKCSTLLHVAVFSFSSTKFLTVRAGKEVPVRYSYKSDEEFLQKLKDGIRLALGNDPVYLKENIGQYSAAQRAIQSVTIRGDNIFRLELMQGITRTVDVASFTPGAAFAFTRGSNHWRVFGRLHFLFYPIGQNDAHPVLKLATGLDGGVTYEFSRLSSATFYVSAGAGLAFQRFEGKVDNSWETLNGFVVQLMGRVGVRMFRLTDFDFDIFVSGYLPFFPVSEVDSTLFGEDGKGYTPSIQMGIGVGF